MMDFQDPVAIPLINGWVDRTKAIMPERLWAYMPFVSVAYGIAYAFLVKPGEGRPLERFILGAGLGIAASLGFMAVNKGMKKIEAKAGAK